MSKTQFQSISAASWERWTHEHTNHNLVKPNMYKITLFQRRLFWPCPCFMVKLKWGTEDSSWLFLGPICLLGASLVAQMVKNLPAMPETWVQSLGWEDPLKKGMATHSSILACRIPMDRGAFWATILGSQKVGHNWATEHMWAQLGKRPGLGVVQHPGREENIKNHVLENLPEQGIRSKGWDKWESAHSKVYISYPESSVGSKARETGVKVVSLAFQTRGRAALAEGCEWVSVSAARSHLLGFRRKRSLGQWDMGQWSFL